VRSVAEALERKRPKHSGVQARLRAETLHFGVQARGAEKDIVFDDRAGVNRNVILHLDIRADHHVVANVAVLSEHTVLPNLCSFLNMREVPALCAIANFARLIDKSRFVFEVGHMFRSKLSTQDIQLTQIDSPCETSYN
jgi:hypothetical protein